MARAPKKPQAEDTDEAPRYLVNEKSFIEHNLLEAGAETVYWGEEVSENLTPINDAAQAVVDAQSRPHPDKTDGPKPRSARARADAAAAAPTGDGSDGAGDLA